MAKETGLGMAVALDDSGGSARTISNDITNVDWSIPRATQDTTGLDKSAVERLLVLADFSSTISGVFNDASNMSHDVLKNCIINISSKDGNIYDIRSIITE
jgi:hypothetical protein